MTDHYPPDLQAAVDGRLENAEKERPIPECTWCMFDGKPPGGMGWSEYWVEVFRTRKITGLYIRAISRDELRLMMPYIPAPRITEIEAMPVVIPVHLPPDRGLLTLEG